MKVLAWPAFRNRALNPYNWLLYHNLAEVGVKVVEFSRLRVLTGRYDIWHIHWPDTLVPSRDPVQASLYVAALAALMRWQRARGTKIVWTVHNLRSHERIRSWLEGLLWTAFPRHLDGFISLSRTGQKMALERLPALRDLPSFVVPHGHYRDAYPNEISRAKARQALQIPPDAVVLAYFGLVRGYKNVPRLVRAFRQLSNPELVLFVAGRPSSREREAEVRQAAEGDQRVRLVLEYIPEDRVQYYLQAADLVVLPFVEVLNSGSALLALSFDRPVVVPRKGAMGELQDMVGESWVATYEGEFSAEVLTGAIAWAAEAQRSSRAPLDGFDWSKIAEETLGAYRAVLAGP